jgi:hypothetical protein
MTDEMREDSHMPATKGDLAAMKGAFSEFRAEMKADFTEMKDILRRVAITAMNTESRLHDLTRYVHTELVTRKEFHGRMDTFTGRVVDADYSWAKQKQRLDEHARRIAALERRSRPQ